MPTLTMVVESAQAPTVAQAAPPEAQAEAIAASAPLQAIALDPGAQLSEAEAFRLEEQLLHRVLQRIDLSLEERLSDTVSAAVQQQLDTMIPALRAEIESVLRSLVIEALAQELSDNTGSTPAFGAETLG
ncbi:MAG: hypothetical protein WKG52_11725 [Variovorax sp.]